MDHADPGTTPSDGAALDSVYLELSSYFPSAPSIRQSEDEEHSFVHRSIRNQEPHSLDVRGEKVFGYASSLPQESAYSSSPESSSSDGSTRMRHRTRQYYHPSREPPSQDVSELAPSQPHESPQPLLRTSSLSQGPALPVKPQRSSGRRMAGHQGAIPNTSPALDSGNQSSSGSFVADSHSQAHLNHSTVSSQHHRRRHDRRSLAEDDDDGGSNSSRERNRLKTILDAHPTPTSAHQPSRLDYFVRTRAFIEGGGYSGDLPHSSDTTAAPPFSLPGTSVELGTSARGPIPSPSSPSGTRQRRVQKETRRRPRRSSRSFGRSSWGRGEGSHLLRKEVARSARASGTKMVADYGWAALHVLLSVCVALLALHFIGGAEHITQLVFLELRLIAGLGVAVVLIFSLELYHALQPLFVKRSHHRLQGGEDGKESGVEKGQSQGSGREFGNNSSNPGSGMRSLIGSQRRLGGDLHLSLSLQSSVDMTDFSLEFDEEGGKQHQRQSPGLVFGSSSTSSSQDSASDGDS